MERTAPGFQQGSYKLLVAIENETEVVFIPVGIIAVDFHDFGDEAPAWPAFEMHNDVHGVTHIGLNGAVRQVHAALQNAAGEASKALRCGSRMDGRKAPGVSGVEKLQEIEGLATANFAEDQSVGSVTKSCL